MPFDGFTVSMVFKCDIIPMFTWIHEGFNYTERDYLRMYTSAPIFLLFPRPLIQTAVGNSTYVYYVRKHNGLIIFDSVANVTERALRVRNCGCRYFPGRERRDTDGIFVVNDFANDIKANAIPQWNFITPNLVNDVCLIRS